MIDRRGKTAVIISAAFIAAALLAPVEARAKRKGAGQQPESPPAVAPATPTAPAIPAAPSDLNLLSLRVTAMETITDLDLSDEQLTALHAALTGTADASERSAAKSVNGLPEALNALYQGLATNDSEHLSDLRQKVDDVEGNDAVDLDDDVTPTEAAWKASSALAKKLKASQIAAYLAQHADEVADPVEAMMSGLAEIRTDSADDVDDDIKDTADTVSRLVAGVDSAKAKAVAEKVTNWLKAGKEITDADFPARQTGLEAGAHNIVGDVPAMQVMSNWLDGEVATLLSNPELPGAIDAIQKGRLAQ